MPMDEVSANLLRSISRSVWLINGLDHRVGHLVSMTAPDDQRVDTAKG